MRIAPCVGKAGQGARLKRIAEAFRALPVPVVGRIHDNAFVLDIRCLSDEAGFVGQLNKLDIAE